MYQASSLMIALIIVATPVSGQDMSTCPTLAPIFTSKGSDLDTIAVATGADSCTGELGLNSQKSLVCRWDFDFRENASSALFQALITEAQSCFGADTELAADKQVNHPDSYTLKRFQVGELVLNISLKDKTALEKTLVFVRY